MFALCRHRRDIVFWPAPTSTFSRNQHSGGEVCGKRPAGDLNASYRDVGDFDLWVRFFRHARLYSVDALIGGYRFHSDSISASDMARYNQRCDKIIESELNFIPRAGALKAFRRVSSVVKNIPKVRGIWQRLALKSDCPPVVEDQENKWVIREGMRRMKSFSR
jgi:hypothetical protein